MEEAREKVRKDEVKGAGDAIVVAESDLVQMVGLEQERDTLKKEVEQLKEKKKLLEEREKLRSKNRLLGTKRVIPAEAPHVETVGVPMRMVSPATRHKLDGERIVEEFFAPIL